MSRDNITDDGHIDFGSTEVTYPPDFGPTGDAAIVPGSWGHVVEGDQDD